MLSPEDCLDTADAPNKKMVGSFMVWECENYAAARKMLEEDPYWTGNVVRAHAWSFGLSPRLRARAFCSGTRRRPSYAHSSPQSHSSPAKAMECKCRDSASCIVITFNWNTCGQFYEPTRIRIRKTCY